MPLIAQVNPSKVSPVGKVGVTAVVVVVVGAVTGAGAEAVCPVEVFDGDRTLDNQVYSNGLLSIFGTHAFRKSIKYKNLHNIGFMLVIVLDFQKSQILLRLVGLFGL